MTKILYIVLLICTTTFASDTVKKIQNTKKEVKDSAKEYKSIYSKINTISKNIKKENKKLRKLNSDIKILQYKLEKSSKELNAKTEDLDKTKKLQKELLDNKQKLEMELVNYLSQDLSLSLIIKKLGNQDKDEIIQDEVFKNYSVIVQKRLKSLVLDIGKYQEVLLSVEKKINTITEFIETNKKELAQLNTLKTKREKVINDYQKQKNEYSKQLDDVTKQKNKLSKILKTLEVLKNKEDEKARLEEEERIKQAKLEQKKKDEEAKRKKEYTEDTPTATDNMQVRKIGSSYQKARVIRYRGKKYNPPIKKYKIVKHFGTYTDPVYKIKIFNDAIILKSTIKNQKVRAVLTGKVIFAKKMPTLGNVVIIKHNNGIHTTYAKLDSISSIVKKGKWVKTGHVIGRVSDELSFQAVKNDKYINPIRFIKVK
jgi:septal ring factor EnvC (AmiA/AmiB activator)